MTRRNAHDKQSHEGQETYSEAWERGSRTESHHENGGRERDGHWNTVAEGVQGRGQPADERGRSAGVGSGIRAVLPSARTPGANEGRSRSMGPTHLNESLRTRYLLIHFEINYYKYCKRNHIRWLTHARTVLLASSCCDPRRRRNPQRRHKHGALPGGSGKHMSFPRRSCICSRRTVMHVAHAAGRSRRVVRGAPGTPTPVHRAVPR